jgi:polyhydroxybutyrate depolymerase
MVSLVFALDPEARLPMPAAAPAAAPTPAAVSLPPQGEFEGRQYRLFLPTGRPSRLVVALHPLYGNPESFEQLTGLDALAARRGWAVLYPAGQHGSWNAGACCGFARRANIDDVGYVFRLIHSVRGTLGFNDEPTHLVGYSNGGMLALEMMCIEPTAVSSVAVIAANLQVRFCGGAKPFLMIRGAQDSTVPPTGGPSTTAQAILFPDFAGLRLILQAARCVPERTTTTTRGLAETSVITCSGRRLGTYVRLAGQGHSYPSPRTKPPFQATEESVAFFDRNP